ncbi:MAG: hypothetical protein M1831_004238 [Alyxoria varia]|nr:MAG: hypothetical protein M1831_004238 [Alyxoria varia]
MQEQARAQGLKAPFRSKCANCGNAFKTEEVMLGIFDDFIWCNRCVGVRAGALDEQPPRALSEYSPPRRSTRPAQTDSPVSKASRHGLFTPQTPESKTKGGRPAFPPSAVPENRGGPSGLAHVTSKSQGSKNRSTTISTPTKSSENDKGALSRKAHGEGEELDVDPNESAESSDDDLDDDEDD